MRTRVASGAFAVIVLSSVTVKWTVFGSDLYPYKISQPSSFRHLVIATSSGQRSDFFFPELLGSFTTNVNVTATAGHIVDDEVSYLRSHNGKHVQKSGMLRIMGRARTVTRAYFHGLTGKWVEEQVSFAANGYTWRLTASYEPRFKRLRATMLRMISSFKLH